GDPGAPAAVTVAFSRAARHRESRHLSSRRGAQHLQAVIVTVGDINPPLCNVDADRVTEGAGTAVIIVQTRRGVPVRAVLLDVSGTRVVHPDIAGGRINCDPTRVVESVSGVELRKSLTPNVQDLPAGVEL